MRPLVLPTVALLVAAGLAGCEETYDPEPASTAEAPTTAPAAASGDLAPRGNSALGKAKGNAKDLVDDLQKRSEELGKDFEDLNDG